MVPSMDFSTLRTHGSRMCCFSVSPQNQFHLIGNLIIDLIHKESDWIMSSSCRQQHSFIPIQRMISWKNVCHVKSRSIAGVCLIWELIEIDDAHCTQSQYKSASVCQRRATYRIKSCRDAITVNHLSLGEKVDSFSLIWVLLNNPEENVISISQLISFNGVLILSWSMDFVLDVSPKICPWGKSTFEANGPKLTFGTSLEL